MMISVMSIWHASFKFFVPRHNVKFISGLALAKTIYKMAKNPSPINLQADKIFAISDLHVDHKDNRALIESWSPCRYTEDILIVAGDVTDNLPLLEGTLCDLKEKFREVFFVPGNHDLWIRSQEGDSKDSISKFNDILQMCDNYGVYYTPKKVVFSPDSSVWIVPLFSWYSKPEEDSHNSLYYTRETGPQDFASMDRMWMDTHLCRWNSLPAGLTVSQYFTLMNKEVVLSSYDSPVISFSHFLPRTDLVAPCESETHETEEERKVNNLGPIPERQGGPKGFNFSRYAGCGLIEDQIRTLKSTVHVHGHQHRNRDREIAGTRYVSHCLGYPHEQKEGWVWGLKKWNMGPKQIWPMT